jgi:hypothetical protein
MTEKKERGGKKNKSIKNIFKYHLLSQKLCEAGLLVYRQAEKTKRKEKAPRTK